MPVSFLFTDKVMRDAFSKKTTPFATLSRQIVDKAFEIFQQFDGFSMFITHQTFDHVKMAFDSSQLARFENAFNKEKTTQGVSGFTAESLNTISESAKKLSLSYYTIVVADDDEKQNIYHNPRIVVLNSGELINYFIEANELNEALRKTLKDSEYVDYFVLAVFKRDICNKLKELI